ncbi:MAG: NAD(P)-dependent oxidoreductase [Planctomycetota bacterium]
MSNPTPVTVLGLGAMGSRIAKRLSEAGFAVTTWNRSPTAELRGTRIAGSIGEAVSGARFVLAMVTNDDASGAIWREAAPSMADGAVAIESSTVTPGWIRTLAMELPVPLVEAPVVGSRPQADAGQLIGLTAGDAVDECADVLDAFCGRRFHMGAHGQAAIAKLAVNTFFATQIAAASEAVSFLRRGGVTDEQWLDLLTNLPVTAPPVAGALQGIAAGQFAPMFPINLVEKDLGYFEQAVETRYPVAAATRELFVQARRAGFGDENIHGVAKVFV